MVVFMDIFIYDFIDEWIDGLMNWQIHVDGIIDGRIKLLMN